MQDFDSLPDDAQTYGGIGQTIGAGVEGVGRGIAGPIFTGGEEVLSQAGVPGLDAISRSARESQHPWVSGAGEGLGLVTGALTGTGEAAVLGKIGEAASGLGEAAGIGGKGAGIIAKIGSSAVKGAAENAAYQLGSDASNAINDPNSIQSAIPNMGLAAIIGGSLGAAGGTVGSLWKATAQPKLAALLTTIADRTGGIEGVIPDPVNEALSRTGMDIAPEIKAGMSNDPVLKEAFSALSQSDTTNTGREFQQTINNFKDQAGDKLVSSLGADPENIPDEFDQYTQGKNIGETLSDEVNARVQPLKAAYEDFATKYAGKDLAPGTTDLLSQKIGQLAQSEGWTVSPSSDIMSEVNRVQKELPGLRSLQNLSDYIKAVGSNTQGDIMNGPLRRAGMGMIGILRDAEGDAIGNHIGSEEGAETLNNYRSTQKAYANESQIKEELASRLGKLGSTSGYGDVIKEMANTDGEAVFRKLSGKNDADGLRLLSQEFPKTAQAVREAHLQQLLSKSQTAGEIVPERLMGNIRKLSPQLKDFIIPKESAATVDGIGQVLDQLRDQTHNWSNTGRALDKMFQYVPGSAVGLISMLMGHNPAVSFLIGGLTKYLAKDAPDAARLALLKWAGSSQPVDAGAFKTMFDVIHSTLKGQDLTRRAARAVFSAGSKVIPDHLVATDQKIDKLDESLKDREKNPDSMLEIAGSLPHYMPGHAMGVSQTAMTAVNYLNAQRPKNGKLNPLDNEIPISEAKNNQFKKTLGLAQQPMGIIQNIKDGRLLPEDVQTIKALYPDYYNKVGQELSMAMADHLERGGTVPYRLKQSISMYLGHPMESTMTPQAIQSIQAIYAPKPQPPGVPGKSARAPKNTGKMGKIAENHYTQDQAAAQRATATD